jgi:hypothetical protein
VITWEAMLRLGSRVAARIELWPGNHRRLVPLAATTVVPLPKGVDHDLAPGGIVEDRAVGIAAGLTVG